MANLPINKHISSGFNKIIEELREAVLEMGGMVEKQLQDSLNSLVKGDIALAKKVIKHDKKINHKDVKIDRMCMEILALRQPTASDLRLVLSVVKAITDLERIGDLSQHLARMGKKLADKGYSMRYYAEIEHTGDKAQRMLKASLNAFARMDAEAALKAMEMEKDINRESRALTRQVATYMMEDPREIKKAMKLLNAIKAIERIGDHCENLCEYTVYFVRGEDIRYQDFDEVKNRILDGED